MRVERVRPEAIAALTQVPEVVRQVRAVAAQIRDEARVNARAHGLVDTPSKGGVKSIQVRRVYDRATRRVAFRVSWDADHFYMRFAETGTQHQKATPFLGPAAAKHQI